MKAFHPASEIFPLMEGSEFDQLVADIKEHGLLEPIVLCDGMVLDGRNRMRACNVAGRQQRFEDWQETEMTPTEWVISKNLHRRHLTVAQRAALALDLLPKLEAEAHERSGARTDLRPQTDTGYGRADEKAAELVGIGRSTVANTKAIQGRAPDLVDQMRTGSITVAEASRRAGFEGQSARGRGPIENGEQTVYFGKGDKWREATQPLLRYLKGFEKRGYEFSHVPPREAQKRLETIDALTDALLFARADLSDRASVYRLTSGKEH